MGMQKLSSGVVTVVHVRCEPLTFSDGCGLCRLGDFVVFFNEFCSPRMGACVNMLLLLDNSLPDFLSHIESHI